MKSKAWWFKRRRYGWGWYPVSVEGWLVTVAYLIGVVALGLLSPSWRFGGIAVSTVALLWVCFIKGPAPRWRWGLSEEDDPREDV